MRGGEAEGKVGTSVCGLREQTGRLMLMLAGCQGRFDQLCKQPASMWGVREREREHVNGWRDHLEARGEEVLGGLMAAITQTLLFNILLRCVLTVGFILVSIVI